MIDFLVFLVFHNFKTVDFFSVIAHFVKSFLKPPIFYFISAVFTLCVLKVGLSCRTRGHNDEFSLGEGLRGGGVNEYKIKYYCRAVVVELIAGTSHRTKSFVRHILCFCFFRMAIKCQHESRWVGGCAAGSTQ